MYHSQTLSFVSWFVFNLEWEIKIPTHLWEPGNFFYKPQFSSSSNNSKISIVWFPNFNEISFLSPRLDLKFEQIKEILFPDFVQSLEFLIIFHFQADCPWYESLRLLIDTRNQGLVRVDPYWVTKKLLKWASYELTVGVFWIFEFDSLKDYLYISSTNMISSSLKVSCRIK